MRTSLLASCQLLEILRTSSDPYVKQHVFINKHMSFAEREVAYQKRLEKRSSKHGYIGTTPVSSIVRESATDMGVTNASSIDIVPNDQFSADIPSASQQRSDGIEPGTSH